RADLSATDQQSLNEKLTILKANPAVHIRIAGNCDERGSDEYNLALGNRRALRAKEYLVQRGVAADRIEVISNGKEQPIDARHTEQAWAMNRNDQFTATNNVTLHAPS